MLEMSADILGVTGRCVDARSNRSRTHVDLSNQRLRLAESVDVLEDGVSECVEFLTESHRDGVLQLRATHLDVRPELLALVQESSGERNHRQLEIRDAGMQCQLDRCRINVVRRLTEVEMVVRMNELVLPALMSEYLQRPIRHHFIDVHVARGAGASLDHVHAELIVMKSLANLGGRLTDGVNYIAIEQLHLEIGERRCFLYRCECGDESGKFAQLDAADGEVLDGAQRLNSVESVGGYVTFPQQIVLAPGRSLQIDSRSLCRIQPQLSQTGRTRRLHA